MEKKDRNIIILLMLLQAVITIPFIDAFPIALDEPFSIFYAQQDIGEFLPIINQGNNSPLHFVLLHFWIKLFGVTPFAVRSLSLVLSLIAIPVLYQLSKQISSRKWAVLTVFLFVFSKFLHLHAIESRMYMLFVLLFILILFVLNQILLLGKNKFIFLIVLNVLLFYTHYLSFFVFLSEFLVFLVFWRKAIVFWKSIIFGILSFLLAILPGLLVLFNRIDTGATQDSWVPKPHITELYGNILRFFNGTLICFIILVIVLVLYFIKKPTIKIANLLSPQFKLISIIFLANYIGMYVFSVLIQPVFIDRYLLFNSIPLFLIFTYLLYRVFGDLHWIYLFVIGIPFIFNVHLIPNTNRNPDKIAAILLRNDKEVKRMYVSPPWINLSIMYYYDLAIFKDYKTYKAHALKEIYSLEEMDRTQDFMLVNSREGFVKSKEEVVNKFSATHVLFEYYFVNELYDVFYFKLK
ncbi:hypothetical protein DNU06_06565 [Putridiphycobacter roseus]|uniref:Uncharacterized protein n=1 Tax=Putridiphycobacter roseus TaxID=2219161 RepID=A0A2W1NHT6_9FLAO|nr:glycosyltransferase family 39 protein [Putridiphycobacter roseus]PZE17486.1 hypothetical protein DNU06_06565 [Putridiphycobacter roseus]